MMERVTEGTSRFGRTLKRPRPVYEPSSEFEDDCEECEESGEDEDEDEEEEEDDDTSLSGFIVGDDEEDESYEPSEETEEEYESSDPSTEDEESGPVVVRRKGLISALVRFSEAEDLEPGLDQAEVLARMIGRGYKFAFLRPIEQLKLYPYYRSGREPPADLVRALFGL